jgi:hypothetical protein
MGKEAFRPDQAPLKTGTPEAYGALNSTTQNRVTSSGKGIWKPEV